MKTFKEIIKYLTNINGGCTINRELDVPKKGYMVGVKGFETLEEMLKEELKENEFFGTWVDVEDNNKIYYDISTNILDKEKALELANTRNELAIFDIANCTSIYL